MKNFKNRKSKTLIFGGSKGIGKIIFEMFRKNKEDAYVFSRKKNSDRNIQVDLSKQKSIDQMLKKQFFKNIKIKNIVFCQRHRGEDVQDHVNVSVIATEKLIKKFERYMIKGCSIVFINSIASKYIVSEQNLGYHISKSALGTLTKFYAIKFGGKQIRVNSISPGTVIKPESTKFFKSNKEFKIISQHTIPLKRLCNTDDIANLVEFLCGKKASYITGQNIFLDGGLSCIGHESIARKLI